jgi:hypothetical protein
MVSHRGKRARIHYAAKMRAPQLPFSLLLSALDLTLWVFLALVPATLYYFGSLADSSGSRSAYMRQLRVLDLTPREFAALALDDEMEGSGKVMTALNLPGLIVEAATSLPTAWPESWHPSFIELFAWRALSYPIYALPAWWLAGASIDALLRRRRVHLAAAVPTALLSAFCLVAAIMIPLTATSGDRSDRWMIVGFPLWAILFGLTPLSWWMQRRRDRLAHVDSAPAG